MIDSSTATYESGEILEQYRRVKLHTDGKLYYADATDETPIGVTRFAALTAGDDVAVWLYSKEGNHEVEASGAISLGATAYAAADGKIASSGTVIVGQLVKEAATASGDIVEVAIPNAVKPQYVTRANLSQDDLKAYQINLFDLRTHDAVMTALPTTAANDDLAVIAGTYGTAGVALKSSDSGGTSVTQYGRFRFAMPPEYVDGETVTIRVNGAMETVADTSAALDCECYKASAPSTDICATAAQSINDTDDADYDFTITPTGLVAGDILDVRLKVAIADSGDAAADINAAFNTVAVLCDIKG